MYLPLHISSSVILVAVLSAATYYDLKYRAVPRWLWLALIPTMFSAFVQTYYELEIEHLPWSSSLVTIGITVVVLCFTVLLVRDVGFADFLGINFIFTSLTYNLLTLKLLYFVAAAICLVLIAYIPRDLFGKIHPIQVPFMLPLMLGTVATVIGSFL